MSKSLCMSVCSLFLCSMLTTTSLAETATNSSHHNHHKGNWMVGYKYKYNHFSGNKEGGNSVSPASLMSRYGDVTLDMTMEMHMLEIMYGLTENLTLMVMPQYMKMDMLHASSHGGGHMHQHEVDGFGDTEVTGIYSFFEKTDGNITSTANVNLGVSLPTGKSDAKFINHHDKEFNLPYNMQFGSGTFDPIIGATYEVKSAEFSWGLQTLNYIRVGKNNEGYRQGHKYTANAWVAHDITDYAGAFFRLEGEAWDNVAGSDRKLPITTIVGADPDGQAGERLMANIGMNFLTGEKFHNQKFTVEFGMPLYERFDGPQSETDYRLTAGWQLSF